MRFDEVELEAVLVPGLPETEPAALAPATDDAPRWRRLLAVVTDLSLFAALTLALLPLLPAAPSSLHLGSLAGFVFVLSYYYFAGSWLLWGKTIGGAIFDVRVISNDGAMTLRNASMRWVALYLSLLTGGIGLALAALPSRRSLPDRMSSTHCVAR
jgi:uncharacterized RDD family membrane protein YckC